MKRSTRLIIIFIVILISLFVYFAYGKASSTSGKTKVIQLHTKPGEEGWTIEQWAVDCYKQPESRNFIQTRTNAMCHLLTAFASSFLYLCNNPNDSEIRYLQNEVTTLCSHMDSLLLASAVPAPLPVTEKTSNTRKKRGKKQRLVTWALYSFQSGTTLHVIQKSEGYHPTPASTR